MEKAETILVEKSQYEYLINIFNHSVIAGRYEPHEFTSFVDTLLDYGLCIEALMLSNRCSEDVFDNVPDIIITTKEEMFSEN